MFTVLARFFAVCQTKTKEALQAVSKSSILYACVLIVILVIVGTFSYNFLEGWPLIDALYATIITMTTVGYGDLSPQSAAGRIFAIFFTLAAIGIAGYTISTVAAFVIEREHKRVKRLIWERRMKQITDLQDHIIICGGGYVGKRVASEFYRNQTPFIVVEADEDLLRWTLLYLHQDYVTRKIRQFRDFSYNDHDTSDYESTDIAELAEEVGIPYLQEDANQDKTLIRAGIERARGLIAAADDDKHNLFVVLGARQLAKRFNNPKLRIVTRVIDEENTGRLLAAGADKALSPNFIGGFQMASHMITPELGAFWDHMLYGDEEMLRFADVHLRDNPDLVGETVGDLKHRQNQVVVAIKRAGEYHYTPEPETRLEENDILIVLGTSAGVRQKTVELTTRY